MHEAFWGIDLGGTKIEGVVLSVPSSDSLEVLARMRIPTESDHGYNHILSRIDLLLSMMSAETGLSKPKKLGIGTPGVLRPSTQTMKNCNTTCLNHQPFLADLQERLGLEVSMANDADCFALAEATFGAGRGFQSVFGIILGTGVGAGIVLGGNLHQGPNGLAGEWGHMTLDRMGDECYCGRRGCVEQYLSGPAVERHHFEATGQKITLKELSRTQTPESVQTIRWMCQQFGFALAQVVNVLDPDIIILGGGAGQVPQLLNQGVVELKRNVFGPDMCTRIVIPELGDSAGVFGAALLTKTIPVTSKL